MKNQKKHSNIFTNEEYQILVKAACDAEGGATEEQIMEFIQICEQMAIAADILNLLLDEKITVGKHAKENTAYKLKE